MKQKKTKLVLEKSSKCCAGNQAFSKMHICVLERLMSETDPATKEQIVPETIVHNDLLKIQIMLLKEAILAQSQKQNWNFLMCKAFLLHVTSSCLSAVLTLTPFIDCAVMFRSDWDCWVERRLWANLQIYMPNLCVMFCKSNINAFHRMCCDVSLWLRLLGGAQTLWTNLQIYMPDLCMMFCDIPCLKRPPLNGHFSKDKSHITILLILEPFKSGAHDVL